MSAASTLAIEAFGLEKSFGTSRAVRGESVCLYDRKYRERV